MSMSLRHFQVCTWVKHFKDMTMKPFLYTVCHSVFLCCPGLCSWFCSIWTLSCITLKFRCLKWMSVAMVLECYSRTRSFRSDTNAESILFSYNPPVPITQLTYTYLFNICILFTYDCVYISILCILLEFAIVYYHCHFIKTSGKTLY